MNAYTRLAIALFLPLATFTSGECQSAPNWMSYQGKLSSGSGVPIADGTVAVTFRLYSQPTGGVALWTESKSVQVRKGVFASQLGLPTTEGGTPFVPNLFSQRLWLGITVSGGTEMVPRQELNAVPYALGMFPGSITETMISNNAVTTGKLADNSVTSAKLAADQGSLAKITSNALILNSFGIQVPENKYVGMNLSDRFSYGGRDVGHYSLGWYFGGDPDWTGGATARLSAAAGIKLFTSGGYRFGISPAGDTLTKGRLFIHNRGWIDPNPYVDLAIGDNDTGFNWGGDGGISFVTDNTERMALRTNRLESNVPFFAPAFNASSSARYKKNVHSMDDAMATIKALRAVSYDRIDSGKHEIGFIAEEVAKVIPEIVAQNEKGQPEAIDYTRFSAVLVKAMQEQQKQLDQEKRARKSLEAKMDALEKRLTRLEKGR